MKIALVTADRDRKQWKLLNRMVDGSFRASPDILHTGQLTEEGIEEYDLVFCLGKEAYESVYKLHDKAIALPDEERLIDTEENQDTREWTWNKLQEVKRELDSRQDNKQTNSLTKESLPPITANQVAEIEKQNPNGWVGKTSSGKTVRLSKQPVEGSEDIQLTFAELYALKVAVELLDVTEFTLVPSTQTNTNRSK